MFRPAGYSVVDYGHMIECEPRMGIYAEAMRAAITPGCTVIDLGAGFGVFALLACKYGAGHVIAIEPDPSIEQLMPMAKANGFADRITVVRDISTNYTPETKADVIVSDCRGSISLYQHHVATLADARARLLAPGGTLLPMRDTLRIALAQWVSNRRSTIRPWLTNNFGLDLSVGYRFAVNEERKAYLRPEDLMSAAAELAVIDFRTITDPNLDATVELVAERGGAVDGLLIWFDAEIAEGLTYSNAPGEPELVYGQMFLALDNAPRLAAGDRVTVRLRGILQGDDYLWTWDWQVLDAAGTPRGPSVRQSTFLSHMFSPKALARASDLNTPALNSQMMIDRDCLALVGDGRTLDEIARTLQERHPEHLPTHQAALDHAALCLGRYNRG
ncbi:50S ribosomal protein L11 methyltransferase [Erythrobacter oryzae]|uniref:50S ribosomal protein L11 methyltransferase n=1 Tax=Erythrobacter oryzae TaxID=3019556 RepID=UPI002554116B|nr:class I SAM-dependent methyltransferase [Erythrobacter sp. COR-2]